MKSNLPLILMYHGITIENGTVSKLRDTGADIYDVSIENFRNQISWLKSRNYSMTTITDRDENDEAQVILTFDDGELSNYEQALSILKEFNARAYFFIIVNRVGKEGYMSWDQIRKLHEAGMIIGSHGLSHEILTNLLDTQIEQELAASKRTIEKNLDILVEDISIPRGFCNNKIIQMAREVGYNNVFISNKPSRVTESCLTRVAVKRTWTMKRFEQAILLEVPKREWLVNVLKQIVQRIIGESGYNWLRSGLVKIFK